MKLPTAGTWLEHGSRHRWILTVVVLLQLFLFADYHWERWFKALAGRDQPPVQLGEGLVIRCDGLGYYAWLRSLLIDSDWSFDNEFDEHNPLGDCVPPASRRTDTGRRPNPWSVGPACLWSIVVVPGHVILSCLEDWGLPWPADGYSLPYQLMVGISTLALSLLGLAFLYNICRKFAAPERAALAAAFLVLSTTIVYYSTIEGSMAHGTGTAVVAALVWYWLRTYGSESRLRWFLVGTLLGAAALTRWQLATLAVLPIGEWVIKRGERRRARDEGRSLLAPRPSFLAPVWLVAGSGALLLFLPQMIAWKIVYGHWLVAPYPAAHSWGNPSWWQVLLAQDRGLFYWTPLALMAVSGYLVFLFGYLKRWRITRTPVAFPATPVVLLFAAFVIQVYVVAALFGNEVYLGAAYGFRHLTESMVLLAPGLALLLDRAPPRRYRLLCGVGCLLILWNLVLISQYRYGYIPADGGAEPGTLLVNAVRLLQRKRWLLLEQTVLGPVLLGVIIFMKRTRHRGAPGWRWRRTRPAIQATPMHSFHFISRHAKPVK
jgi:hypothetical protein